MYFGTQQKRKVFATWDHIDLMSLNQLMNHFQLIDSGIQYLNTFFQNWRTCAQEKESLKKILNYFFFLLVDKSISNSRII